VLERVDPKDSLARTGKMSQTGVLRSHIARNFSSKDILSKMFRLLHSRTYSYLALSKWWYQCH